MRLPFRRRPSAQRPRQTAASNILSIAALAPALASAMEYAEIPDANLDLSQLGRIGMAGDFTGVSLYQYEGQSETPVSRNGSESLFTRLPNGAFATIATTDASIHDMCESFLDSGEMAGVVIAGNFTSVDGTPSQGVALYNVTSEEFVSLDGLTGQVNALLCDGESNRVYVGGNFRHTENSSNAVMWVHGEGWTTLPFSGFNGPVSSIAKASDDHIIFGGSFSSLGNASSSTSPDGQIINLSTANITSGSTSDRDGFDDPENIICSSGEDGSGNTWLLEDDSPGFWQASFGYMFTPTRIRVWNTRQDGRGTRTWRYSAIPDGGIMNLTYVDPESNQNISCTSECPLGDDPDEQYRDFNFVNTVGMPGFRIDISDFYGDGGGLNGIQVFSEDVLAYAVNDFNEPSCEAIGIETPSEAAANGPWRQAPRQDESRAGYLTAQLDGDESDNQPSVVFRPNIQVPGNYSILMHTPGCMPDDTCQSRGEVNVTGEMTLGEEGRFSTTLFQTNNFDKFDQIYFGMVEASSTSGFRPSITLSPLAGQSTENMTIAAQAISFTLLNSTGGLNGLFDFDPNDDDFDSDDLTSSAFHQLGSNFTSDSAVHALIANDNLMVIAGNFSSDDASNIIGIDTSDQSVRRLNGGLNDEVKSMHLEEPLLYVGGGFDNTESDDEEGLNNVAVYHIDQDTWSSLGAGVNGKVSHVVPLQINATDDGPEIVIAFTGAFDEINEFDDYEAIAVSGFAIWVPSENNWLQNIGGIMPSYNGILTASILELPGESAALFAGSMGYASIGANGAVTLGDELGQFPVQIQAPTTDSESGSSGSSGSSSVTRRDILSNSQGDVNGVLAGTYYTDDDRNVTILAGHFSAQHSNGSTIHNLVFIDSSDDDATSGISSDISENSTFVALAILDDVLYAGGDVSGRVGSDTIQGLITYNFTSADLGSQPPALNGGNGTVSAIGIRPDSTEVYVGGSFGSAGSLDCPGVCYYNTDLSQWNRPGLGLDGSVNALMWTSSSQLIAAGDMNVNDSSVSLVTYDPEEQVWSAFPGASELPGPVDAMTRGSQDGEQLWVAGSDSDGAVFLMKYDGSDWNTVEETLDPETVIHSLQIFSVTEDHEEADLLHDNQVLMLTGSIAIPDFGTASAAIYNGTEFTPYALTITSGNHTGTISQMFTENNEFFTDDDDNLALVFVVLIGLAIALGLMFLLVVAGLLLDRLRKKREGYTPAPTSMYDRGNGLKKIPPGELLQSLGKGRPDVPPRI